MQDLRDAIRGLRAAPIVSAAALVLGGVLIGTVTSRWAGRFTSALLFGLEPPEPTTLRGEAAIVPAAIGGVAGWLPARRAARIYPATVLREVR